MTPRNKQTASVTAKFTNDIIEDNGDWLLVDISTPKHPTATMAVDTDAFTAHEGGRIRANDMGCSKNIYAVYNRNKKGFLFHRDFLDAGDLHIDHINPITENFVDNRRSNLRIVTVSQNAMNRRVSSNNTSGIPGVYWNLNEKKWRAYITINRKMKHLGCFDNKDHAIGARQQAEREYFGEFAYKGDK